MATVRREAPLFKALPSNTQIPKYPKARALEILQQNPALGVPPYKDYEEPPKTRF